MKFLRASAWVPVPWKNGGGIMYDLAHATADAGATSWRAGVAEIEKDGMFSHFDGIDRHTALLSGAGIRLDVDGLPPLLLRDNAAVISYPGDRETSCALLEGPSRVLNVMVARGRVSASIERRRIDDAVTFERPGSVIFLFCLDGSITVGGTVLHRHDCAHGAGPIDCDGHADLLVATLTGPGIGGH